MSALLTGAAHSRPDMDEGCALSHPPLEAYEEGCEMVRGVNLDAMIRREDLDITENTKTQVNIGHELKLMELELSSPTLNILRKPDFQRETANWPSEKICGLIESFVDGYLIPSVIVWRSDKSGKVFVIDGAHRLSAFIAWINDDYGDETLSRRLFGNLDSNSPQRKIAKTTRDLIRQRIGVYSRLKGYITTPDDAPSEQDLVRARNAISFSIKLETVNGDISKAERSFFKINQSATPITSTELMLIKARRKANAIATRALMHAGAGHAYWAVFDDETQNRIKDLARETYDDLFKPILEYPIRTLQLPVGGAAATAESVDLVFNLVNHINSVIDTSTKNKEGTWKHLAPNGIDQMDLTDDTDGSLTVKFLQAVRQATRDVFGPGDGSLSLHPGIYCYGATGRFLPTAFFGAIGFVQWLKLHRKFIPFTDARKRFCRLVSVLHKSDRRHDWRSAKGLVRYY